MAPAKRLDKSHIAFLALVVGLGVYNIFQTHHYIAAQEALDKRLSEVKLELSDALTGESFSAGANVGMWCAWAVLHSKESMIESEPCRAATMKGRAGLDWYSAHKDTWAVGKP